MNTDNEIITASVEDPGRFAVIFDRHAIAVGGYARRRIGLDAVDDILSETFLIAFRQRASFDQSVPTALPWLLGIATRVMHRYRRHEIRQWRAEAASVPEHLDSHEQSADAKLDAAAAIRALKPRIARLSSDERDVLFLHAWADLTYEQIAMALNIPIGTVRSRLARARRRLAPSGSTLTKLHTAHDEENEHGPVAARA